VGGYFCIKIIDVIATGNHPPADKETFIITHLAGLVHDP